MSKKQKYVSAVKEILEEQEHKLKTLRTRDLLDEHGKRKMVEESLKDLGRAYAEANVDYNIIAEQGLDFSESFMSGYSKGILNEYNKASVNKGLETAVKETKLKRKKDVIVIR